MSRSISGCKNPKSMAYFLNSSQRVKRMTKTVFTVMMKIVLQFVILPAAIASFAAYFFTDSGRDSFALPIPMWYIFSIEISYARLNSFQFDKLSLVCERFPFDWNTPIGYLNAVILEYIFIGYQYIVNACTTGLAVGTFWLSIPAIKELENILHSVNVQARRRRNRSNTSNELKALLKEYICTHGAVKQLSLYYFKLPKYFCMTNDH